MKAARLMKTMLFEGMTEQEIETVLGCLSAQERVFSKNEYIYHIGDVTGRLGIILEGAVNIARDDSWGGQRIIENIGTGHIFAETYACLKGEPMMVDVQATEKTSVLFIDIHRLSTTCSRACNVHSRLIERLLYVMARKNMMLTKKMDIITPKSLRERVMVYLSQEAVRQCKKTFSVPFNRQQMADYLSVDRSALSAELSRMKKQGMIAYERNSFTIYF